VTSAAPERVDPAAAARRARRFAANVLWMLVSSGAGKVAGFVFVAIVARALGATDYGYFNFALSFVPLFLMFGSWGIGIMVTSEVARDHERLSEVFASGFVLRIGLAFVGLLLALSAAPLFVHGWTSFLTVAIVGLSLFLDEISGYLANVFKAFEQMRYMSLVTLTNRVGSTILAVIAVVLGRGLIAVAVTYFLGSLGALLFAATTLRRRFPPIRLADRRTPVMRQLLGRGILLGAASILNMALFRIDTVMLQAFRGATAVGMYGVAYRFIDSFLFVAWGVTNAALPRLARAANAVERTRALEVTAAISLAFYVPLAVIALFCSRWLVVTLFSDRYAMAVPAVPWLTSAALFYALAYAARVSAIVTGQRKAIAAIAAFGLVFNVALNLVVIPRYGFLGAAVTTFVSEVLDALLLLGLVLSVNGRLLAGRIISVPLGAGAAAAITLAASGLRGGSGIAIGLAVYVLALVYLGRLLAPVEARRAAGLLRRDAPAG
jgi:O-antigen/teichoic acid export membrane protein